MLSPSPSPADEAASAPGRRTLWQRVATRQFLFISIAAHLLLAGGASVFYIKTVAARKKTGFAAPPAAVGASTHALEHKVQMQKKQQTMSAPAQMRRITTTAVNTRAALPAIPAAPLAGAVSPLRMAGMGGSGSGLGIGGGGMGGGTGSGGVGPSLFGLRQKGVSALVGTFYDFKQTPDGKPTSMAVKSEGMLSEPERPGNDENMKLVGRVANGGFNEGSLAQYFRGPAPLYATQIFIPIIPSDDGPKEFGLGDRVKGRRWIVIYRAKVTPPESGRYHFVGVADDYLVVRFRHQLVLDGSLQHPTGKKQVRELFLQGLSGAQRADEGDAFNVSAGEGYDLEILIGEQPGGETCAFLLLEKEGAEYAKDAKGNPILPVFKVAPGNADHSGRGAPVTAADASWSVWRAEKQ